MEHIGQFNDELREIHRQGKQDPIEIIEENEKFYEHFGLYTYEITDEMIEALKEGKALAIDIDREYTALIWKERVEE